MAFSFLKRLFDSDSTVEGKVPPMVDAPATTGEVSTEVANAPTVEDMEKFVIYAVSALVDQPEDVRVNRVVKGDLVVLQVHCFKKDIGKVIGKSGKTISALRVLVSSASARSGQRMTVDVMDD